MNEHTSSKLPGTERSLVMLSGRQPTIHADQISPRDTEKTVPLVPDNPPGLKGRTEEEIRIPVTCTHYGDDVDNEKVFVFMNPIKSYFFNQTT